ncbi:hypothetical protein L1D14_07040 [Vibrio tubiashii]|uniref:hypothetical protein n=1 Tax=Vibrio tubiashii TaxID=29498 RepID=UPI001EFDC46F|nr:hypothetical protein [Vibrio tubiashii]MCG9575994.1 hypothetical protein [Vibrio tubiashii]
MKSHKKINYLMYKLLIQENRDGFEVLEARDALMGAFAVSTDANEARKQIYRQLRFFERKGWLKTNGSGRSKKYFQTSKFKEMSVTPRLKAPLLYLDNAPTIENNYCTLETELKQNQKDLEILIAEESEYLTLQSRFPELKTRLSVLVQGSKKRHVSLLGRINALKGVLESISKGSYGKSLS